VEIKIVEVKELKKTLPPSFIQATSLEVLFFYILFRNKCQHLKGGRR